MSISILIVILTVIPFKCCDGKTEKERNFKNHVAKREDTPRLFLRYPLDKSAANVSRISWIRAHCCHHTTACVHYATVTVVVGIVCFTLLPCMLSFVA